MLHKTNINCIFVERYSTRYDYAYTEVRGKFDCDRAQAAYQDCEVRQDASQNYPAGQYTPCCRQERKEAHDRSGSRIAFNTSATTVQKVRTSYGEKGLEATVNRKKRETPPVEAKVTGDVEAHIIAMACGEPPKGYAKWTLRLLADKSVKLGYIDSISHTQVGRILKKTNISLT